MRSRSCRRATTARSRSWRTAAASDYGARYAPFAYADDPNFNVKSFRTTNVLRWEYKPGSTLFVVWQQARENDAVPGGFQFGRDMHDIFGVAPRNVFLVKLAYWLNYWIAGTRGLGDLGPICSSPHSPHSPQVPYCL